MLRLAVTAAVLAAAPGPPADSATFTVLDAGLPTAGQWRQGFALADLDGDGDLDLAHGPTRLGRGRPRLFVNDGKASFTPWATARFPEEPTLDYGDVAVADFDGDGAADLLFGVHQRGLGVLMGDQRGGFAALPGVPAWEEAAAFPTIAVDAVDWDGDGRTDVIALGEGPQPGRKGAAYGLRVLLNGADGWRQLAGEDPGPLFGDGLAIGDLDGDGRPDAAAVSRSTRHHGQLFLGRGADGWAVAPAPFRETAYVFAVSVCDLDGDGRDELVLGFLDRVPDGWRSGLDLLELEAGSGWRRRTVTEGPGSEDHPRTLACGDLDRDGHLDLVAGSSKGHLTWLRGNGDGGLAAPEEIAEAAAGAGCSVRHLEVADLDGDGGAELVASFSASGEGCANGGALQIWRGSPASVPAADLRQSIKERRQQINPMTLIASTAQTKSEARTTATSSGISVGQH